MNIDIFRRLGESDLIPRLRSCPPTSLAMVESLLIQGDVLQVCRHALEAIWIVDLRVDVLQSLQYPIVLLLPGLLLSALNVWLQEEERPGVFVAVDCSLRNQLRVKRANDSLNPFDPSMVSRRQSILGLLDLIPPHAII